MRANLEAWHSDLKAAFGEGVAIYPDHNLHMLLYAASYDGQGAIAMRAGRDYAKSTDRSFYHALTLLRFGRFDEVLEITDRPEDEIGEPPHVRARVAETPGREEHATSEGKPACRADERGRGRRCGRCLRPAQGAQQQGSGEAGAERRLHERDVDGVELRPGQRREQTEGDEEHQRDAQCAVMVLRQVGAEPCAASLSRSVRRKRETRREPRAPRREWPSRESDVRSKTEGGYCRIALV